MAPRCRFVVPSVATITLSDGDWIQVKNRLSVGEERAAFQSIVGEVSTDGGWRRPNMESIGLAEVAAYLVAWSFRDPQGQPIPPDLATLKLLDPEDYKELEVAVQAHIKKMEDARADAKNATATDGPNVSALTSPSAA
jgi:hypothetical protein